MSEQATPRVKALLAQLDLQPKKSRGQNFLHNEAVAQKIVERSGVDAHETVIEVGPGLGILTRLLAKRVKRLLVVEIDNKLATFIESEIEQIASGDIISQDVRTVELRTVLEERGITNKVSLLSNAPYSISSDILLWILSQRESIRHATILLQKEFAERAAAGPGSKTYGALSIACAQWAECSLGLHVDGRQFHPPAGVASRVLGMRLREAPRAAVDCEKMFRDVVRACFSQRRKMLSNSMRTVSGLGERDAVEAVLQAANVSSSLRPEVLTVEEFAAIANSVTRFLKS